MKAIYIPEQGRKVALDVLKTNQNDTVDLGFEGELVVSSCRVTQEPEIGACMIEAEAKADSKAKK